MINQSAKEVDDDAAGWAMKLGDGGDVPGLEAWLAGDPRRRGALLRAQAALSLLDRARALEAPAVAPAPRHALSRRAWLTMAGAGGLVAAGIGGLAVFGQGERYVTAVGEIRRVPLKDGSVIDINTDTALAVALRGRSRDVVLDGGEAWFQVAKDARRPFVVAAGGARFRAVGTAFSVRRLDLDRAEMLVTEGVVEARLGDGAPVRVAAGQRILLGPGLANAAVSAPAEIERALAWRSGQISLDGLTLAEAAAEFNRYNRRRLVVDNPSLAHRQFVGLFRVDEPQSFATAVAAASGAELTQDSETIRLR